MRGTHRAWLGSLLLAATLFSTTARAEEFKTKITLADAQQAARQHHPRLHTAVAEAQASHDEITVARSEYMPNIVIENVDAYANSKKNVPARILAGWSLAPPPVAGRVAAGVQLKQIVTDFGRTRNNVASAKLLAKASEADVTMTDTEVVLEATLAYLQLLSAQQILQVAEDTVKEREVTLRQIEALTKEGLKSAVDVSFAKVNVSDAKLLLLNAHKQLETARAVLVAAMGGRGEPNIEAVEEPVPRPLPDAATTLNNALAQRPDLKSFRLKVDAAEKRVKAARAGFLPSVELIANVNYLFWIKEPSAYNYIKLNALAGLVVDIPLFQGLEVIGKKRKAEKEREAEKFRLTDAENKILRDVRTTWAAAHAAHDSIEVTQERAKETRVALDAAQARYDHGLGTIVELYEAQLNVTRSLVGEIEAVVEYQQQRAELDYQMGVLR